LVDRVDRADLFDRDDATENGRRPGDDRASNAEELCSPPRNFDDDGEEAAVVPVAKEKYADDVREEGVDDMKGRLPREDGELTPEDGVVVELE
jgi:hypothetical protein